MKSLVYITRRNKSSNRLGDILENYCQLTIIHPDDCIPATTPDAILVEVDILTNGLPLPEAIESATALGIPLVIVGDFPKNKTIHWQSLLPIYKVINEPFLPEDIESIIQALPSKSQITDIVNGALDAVMYVLQAITNSSARQESNTISLHDEEEGYQGRIILSGDIDGTLSIYFPKDLAYQTVALILGCDSSEIERPYICDGVGEITNQIAGRLRTQLSRYEQDIVIAIPEASESKPWYGTQNAVEDSYYFQCLGYPFILRLSIRTKVKESSPV